jgi:signal transduction histidine kinase
MRSIKLASFLSFLLSLLITVILGITGIALSSGYKRVVEDDLKTQLITISKEVQRDHLAFIDGSIKYQRTIEGLSISENLRSKDTSALILDAQLVSIGRYGIFNFPSVTESSFYSEILTLSRQAQFTGNAQIVVNKAFEGNTYELYIVPLSVEQTFQGVAIFAKQGDLAHRLINLNNQLLLIILPFVLLIFWLLGFWIISIGLKPLKDLADLLDRTTLAETQTTVGLKPPRFRELAVLIGAFNRLFERMTLTLEKQKNFIANASHELRTPLTRAISTLDLVIMDKRAVAVREPLETVEKELFSLNRTLEELLVLAKVEGKRITSLAPPLLIDPIIEQQTKSLRGEMLRMHLQFRAQIDPQFTLNISKEMAIILFRNLLGNAVKYNIPNGFVEIDASITNNVRSLSIKNLSDYIEPQSNNKLFERFYRGKKTKLVPGSGLGLSIVQSIADQSNLKIQTHLLKENVFEVMITQPI